MTRWLYSGAPGRKAPAGLTRIEVVMIFVSVALLLSLLLPALAATRDAQDRNQCANHLKQMAVAALNHESAKKFLPSGGWGHNWIGDPDSGLGKNQPGGWAYSILFFMEGAMQIQQTSGLPLDKKLAEGATVVGAGPNATKNEDAVQAIFYCPSRRPDALYPFPAAIRNPGAGGTNYGPTFPPFLFAKGDYAANGGTMAFNNRYNRGNQGNDMQAGTLDDSIARAATSLPTLDATWYLVPYGPPAAGAPAQPISPAPTETTFTGVVWYRSEVKLKWISDGASKVYLFGEKYMDTFNYTSGYDGNGDEENLYVGMDDDNIRLGASAGVYTPVNAPASLTPEQAGWVDVYGAFRYPPRQDAAIWPGRDTDGKRPAGVPVDKFNALRFGSAHPGALNMAFCDGSVLAIAYDIDPEVHARLCDRQDGKALDRSTFIGE